MTSKLNKNSPLRGNSSANRPIDRAPSGGYSASVPISLYRQVAAELQATQALLDSLKTENQQLTQQNQQLQSEIGKVVQSALSLHQVSQSFQAPPPEPLLTVEQPDPPILTEPVRRSSGSPTKAQPISPAFDPMRSVPIAEELFTEQESRPRRPAKPEKSSDLAGWKLTLVVMLIIVTFFGLGFAIVSPLLRNR
jgi:hypothetical protein